MNTRFKTPVKTPNSNKNKINSMLLYQTDVQIRRGVYELNQLTGNDDFIQTLLPGQVKNVEMLRGLPFCCKISILYKRPPLTILVNWTCPEEFCDLTFYGSFTTKEPNEKNHHYKKTRNLNIIRIRPPARGIQLPHKFEGNEYYMTFVSQNSDIKL